MKAIGTLAVVLALAQAPAGEEPPMPYLDFGACPFECCTYRDWIARAPAQAFDSHGQVPSSQQPAFRIAKGETVTGMSGVVITTTAGVVRITKPLTLDVDSERFPRSREQVAVRPGDRLYLLTAKGEGFMSGWFKGRVLESFDATTFAAAGDCQKRKQGCDGVIERQPVSEWWSRVRNSAGKIGWVLIPRRALSFDKMDACG
jgi:hypothetical protein